ncbi:helix-turn-helix transcriptional regulator [Kitasatospora cinereorecta]|uniref:Helix-turn-helix transcriptional regulator n=1 Tax=Kitasatospora cinereorecta TaxID=285560 RepID=A0ABW0V7E9_9ACTN
MITPPSEPNLPTLSRRLARHRADHGRTYDQLAEYSGLARRTIIEIEQGRTLAAWLALAHAFGIPLGDLMAASARATLSPSRTS